MQATQADDCNAGLAPRVVEVDTGAMRFNYLEWGETGKPIALWQGITSDSRGWWRVAPALVARGYHVFAPDLPGHGMSGDAPESYAIEATARLLNSWLRALNLDRPVIVGHSWGGMNALAQANLQEHRVEARAYVLYDPPLRIAHDPSDSRANFLHGLGRPADDTVRAELTAERPHWHACDIFWKARALYLARQDAVRGFFDANAGKDVMALLGKLQTPTLLMLADPHAGGIFEESDLPEIKDTISSSVEMQIIRGAGHNIHRDDFDGFMAALAGFLDRIDQG